MPNIKEMACFLQLLPHPLGHLKHGTQIHRTYFSDTVHVKPVALVKSLFHCKGVLKSAIENVTSCTPVLAFLPVDFCL